MIKPREYKGFVLARDGGHDTPWTAWRTDAPNLRADTLEGIKQLVTHWLSTIIVEKRR